MLIITINRNSSRYSGNRIEYDYTVSENKSVVERGTLTSYAGEEGWRSLLMTLAEQVNEYEVKR